MCSVSGRRGRLVRLVRAARRRESKHVSPVRRPGADWLRRSIRRPLLRCVPFRPIPNSNVFVLCARFFNSRNEVNYQNSSGQYVWFVFESYFFYFIVISILWFCVSNKIVSLLMIYGVSSKIFLTAVRLLNGAGIFADNM